MTQQQLNTHQIVNRDEWIEARKDFLKKEKEFTHARDALSAARRELPWTKVPDYAFEGAEGKVKFEALFKGNSQLIVYHFMLAPGDGEGCKSCSFWADTFNGFGIHLAHRDTTMVAVSRAPYAEIAAYKARMGWSFDWYSSNGSEFNYDFGVSFRAKEGDKVAYNFDVWDFVSDELPGVSVFVKGEDGSIYRTYSAYSRGIDILNGAYNYLDLAPKGRDEQDLSYPMAWLRRHDDYVD